jgi:hypothetical protein
LVRAAAQQLVKERHLLAEDFDAVIDQAAQAWADAVDRRSTSNEVC